jgi:hypothetical protein
MSDIYMIIDVACNVRLSKNPRQLLITLVLNDLGKMKGFVP